MTLIYRVQDRDGRGPWRPGLSDLWVEDRPDLENLQPFFVIWPGILDAAVPGKAVGCGCLKLDDLRRWFTLKEYRRLNAMGFLCVEINADRILASDDVQCVFERLKPLSMGWKPVALYTMSMSDKIR